MYKNLLSIILAAQVLGLAPQVAGAATENDVRTGTVVAQTRTSEKYINDTALIPIKLVALGSALAVGTPIAITRCSATRFNTYMKNLGEECDANEGLTPAMVASVPGQALRQVGTVGEGVLSGGINAIDGWDRPFSAKSFSLKGLEWID